MRRYADVRHEGTSDLSDEPFMGMWRDREDMRDSGAWVRNIRVCWNMKRRQNGF